MEKNVSTSGRLEFQSDLNKIHIAANSVIAISVVSQNDIHSGMPDNTTSSISQMLYERKRVAIAFTNSIDDNEKEHLMEMFKMISENILDTIGF